jgi:hypothetical protein
MGKKTIMRKLNYPSLRTLRHIVAGQPANTGIHGRSAYGGLCRVVQSLYHRGLIDGECGDWHATDAGRAYVTSAEKARE